MLKINLYKNIKNSDNKLASTILINSIIDAYFQTDVYNLNNKKVANTIIKSNTI